MKCTPGETALGMHESGNNVERAKQFSIYFVLMPSWVNKRLFYSGGPRWLGTTLHTKHHWLRLSQNTVAAFLSENDGMDVHLS